MGICWLTALGTSDVQQLFYIKMEIQIGNQLENDDFVIFVDSRGN